MRLARIPDVTAGSLRAFIQANVEPGSVIISDAWQGYASINKAGYTHKKISVRASPQTASDLLPHVHRVASLLKRWLLGTHQGAVHPEQLDFYLDEFTFRFNRRDSKARGMLFYRLLYQAVRTEPRPYGEIAAGPIEAPPRDRPHRHPSAGTSDARYKGHCNERDSPYHRNGRW